MSHLDDDRLVQLGLDGMADADRETARHLDSCADCRAGVAEIATTVRAVGRNGSADLAEGPSEQVWTRIQAQTGVDIPAAGRPSRTKLWIAAAAVIGCLVGGGVTAAVTSGGSPDSPAPPTTSRVEVAKAALSVPTGTGPASGTAVLVKENGRWTLVVDTHGLVAGTGYFEVWLLDAAGRMYALGALPEDSTARLAVPKGISVAQFNVVDISAQRFDGDPSHSRDSVLRGTLSG